MTRAEQPALPSQDDAEAFIVRVLRYLDDDCSADEVGQLKEALAGSASYRQWFVQVCRMQGDLYEVYAPKRAAQEAKVANVAEPSLMSTLAGAVKRGGAPGDANLPEFPLDPEVSEEPSVKDAGADTIHGEFSGEDTMHRQPKTAGQ